ncbi:MAG: hypothetical protein COV52_02740 [Gammaproteobacteria bacterium CG11_big_fil_rev_8_21_14_0_20_46_22]|nr:MAG: hypothetical protein COV52_02740 [Gammaproteobacteria bacterium CG11_big_fil_rev_8_21_14_0_20_46_22]
MPVATSRGNAAVVPLSLLQDSEPLEQVVCLNIEFEKFLLSLILAQFTLLTLPGLKVLMILYKLACEM